MSRLDYLVHDTDTTRRAGTGRHDHLTTTVQALIQRVLLANITLVI